MKNISVTARILAFVAILSAPAAVFAGPNNPGEKPAEVSICHVPPGNPANAHTITVGSAAVESHLTHGDILGVCALLCRADGAGCGDHAECCSGFCSAGICETPCGLDGSECGDSDDCCSGLCGDGICTTPCSGDGAACGANADCCSGTCENGTCAAACGEASSACGVGNDCCSGICGGTTGTCVADCTVGPELGGSECSRDLDCCTGSCIYGLCFVGTPCALPGEPCDQLGLDCCFGDICTDDGQCVAP